MILKVELDKKEIAKSLVHKPDMLFHDGELAEVDVTVTHNIKGIEDAIDALNSVADAIKNPKPGIKGKLGVLNDNIKKTFGEFLDEKKTDKKSVADAIDEVGEDYKPSKNRFDPDDFLRTELGMSLIEYVDQWADDMAWSVSAKHSDANISVAIHKEYFKIYQIALQQFYGISIRFEYHMLDDGENVLKGYVYYLDKNKNEDILFSVLK